MLIDVIGYTSIRIYPNDTYLIPDVRRNFEVCGIDYKLYSAADDRELLNKCIHLIEEYNVSVRDMSGSFLQADRFYSSEDALHELQACMPSDWR